MASLELTIPGLLLREGGYVIDPEDPGGETNYGISKRRFPEEDIKNMTPERATELYRVHFWNLMKLGEVPQGPADAIMDMAVNAGPRVAVRMAQRIVNVEDDGRVGPITLNALNAFDPRTFTERYALARIERYAAIAWRQQRPLSHLVSWVSRSLELQ